MKKGLYVTMIGGIAAALLIGGCEFLLGPDEAVGGGNLAIAFGESGGRGAAPADLDRYDLVLTGPKEQKITVSLAPEERFYQQVALGEWHIDAKAYKAGNVLIGTGSITVTVKPGRNEVRIPMRVVPPEFIAVTGVSLNKTAAAILVGGTETLTATITPANATNQNITWSSSNGSVATVDNTGLVNAMAAGTATIAVTTEDGGFTAVCAVAVAYGISLSPTGPVIFPTAIVGYGAQTTQAVTVTNTWNEATGALMVGLSGTDSGSFTLSTTAIGSIALSDTAAFTVGPNTGLAAGTYTATVTVSGSNGISADFAVSFMVTPLPGTQSVHTINNVNVPFRYVPAGSFQRDSTTANVSIITIGYWMGEMEVTQELFQAVMGANPSNFPSGADGGETQNQRPVESVSWYAAIAFCNKLSILDGKDPVYSVSGVSNWATLAYSDIPISDNTAWNAAVMDTSKNGYRLPTEMEWMWAAMGADKTVQPNTTGYSKAFAGDNGTNSIDNYTWYNSNSNSKTHEVGKKSANELGLYDMSGNVHEWCWDGHGSYPGGNQMDYTGATSDTDRVNRGGSWSSSAPLCAFNARGAGSPGSGSFIGFRVVCP